MGTCTCRYVTYVNASCCPSIHANEWLMAMLLWLQKTLRRTITRTVARIGDSSITEEGETTTLITVRNESSHVEYKLSKAPRSRVRAWGELPSIVTC